MPYKLLVTLDIQIIILNHGVNLKLIRNVAIDIYSLIIYR